MIVDYLKGKIYKITNDYNDDVYVGCTCDILSKKMNVHIAEAKRKLREGNLLHKLMRDIGHERFVIDLIENFPCENIYQLRQRQGFFRRQYGTLHKYLDDQDYREKNVERFEGKIMCDCGCEIRKDGLSKHKLTKKHSDLMDKK